MYKFIRRKWLTNSSIMLSSDVECLHYSGQPDSALGRFIFGQLASARSGSNIGESQCLAEKKYSSQIHWTTSRQHGEANVRPTPLTVFVCLVDVKMNPLFWNRFAAGHFGGEIWWFEFSSRVAIEMEILNKQLWGDGNWWFVKHLRRHNTADGRYEFDDMFSFFQILPIHV